MQLEKIVDIPEPDLEKVRQDFESEGAEVETIRQPDGNYTVTARFDRLGVGVDKVLLAADALAHLRPGQIVDRSLAAVVVTCLFGVIELFFRGLWSALATVLVIGSVAMFVLVWRGTRSIPRTPKAPAFQQRYFIIATALVVLIAVGLFGHFVWLNRGASRFHNELVHAGLPPDLYDRQGQLESLTIQQGALTSLDWLDSTALTNLAVANSRLRSLHGLAHTPELRALDIDLRGTSLESLADISSLYRLRELTIRNIGKAKGQHVPTLDAFPDLLKLHLDFERSSISSLPDLAGLQELQDLTLNLRATEAIVELPDLSRLQQLHSLALYVDNSKMRSLKQLAKLEHLQTLTLALDGTQLGLLQGWLSELADRPGPQSLTLFFTTPPNVNLPNFGGVRGLISLGITVPGSEPPARAPILDTSHLDGLRQFTVSAENSEVSALPDIRRLTGLLALNLDLAAGRVATLPDISQLHELQQLTLNLNGTAIRELPDFGQLAASFPRLQELDLQLARSQIHSLRGIEHLHGLRTLSLNISGTTLNDLNSIANIGGLEKLVLRLQWSQVGALPDLASLKDLSEMELDFDDWFDTERLPDLSGVPNLRKLKLVLENSHADLSSLEKISNLAELSLDLKGSSVENLPDLRSLNKLNRVAADIRHSRIQLNQTINLRALEELTIDNTFSTLEHLPQSVKKLVIGP